MDPEQYEKEAEKVRRRVRQAATCEHEEMRLRYRESSNGVIQYRRQCMTCGHLSQAISHAKLSVEEKQNAEEVDDGIAERWYEARNAYVKDAYEQLERKRQQMLAQQNQEWWDWYNGYCRTAEWQARRTAVFNRDNFMCQACLQRPAEQVHHLTYKHVGNEPLFDLVSVCTRCHNTITEMERDREADRHDNKRQLIDVWAPTGATYLDGLYRNGNGRNGQ